MIERKNVVKSLIWRCIIILETTECVFDVLKVSKTCHNSDTTLICSVHNSGIIQRKDSRCIRVELWHLLTVQLLFQDCLMFSPHLKIMKPYSVL